MTVAGGLKKIASGFVLSYLRFFAKLKLAKIHPKIIGVTGSVGKTSEISALHTIISPALKTKTTFKGNSESGIPLEILGIRMKDYSTISWFKTLILAPYFSGDALVNSFHDKFEVLIVEMGVDSPYEPKNMEYLLKIVEPDIGIVLNVEPVHTEQFGSVEKIAEEKMKLAISLSAKQTAILNLDNSYIRAHKKDVKAKVVGFGFEDNNYELQITNYELNGLNTNFQFTYCEEKYELKFENKIFAKEYGYIFAAAILAAKELGVSIDESILRLRNFYVLPPGRLSVLKGEKNSTIIDSSYNSSPTALLTAFNLFKDMKITGKKIVVLGDMRELGSLAPEEHEKIGKMLFGYPDFVIFVGSLMKKYAEPALINTGYSKDKIFSFEKAKGVGEFILKELLGNGDLVLVKGSQNTIFLEQVVYEIMKEKMRAKELLCRQSEYWEKVRQNFFSKTVTR
jgi:UDP-N-acetylmuramoyl-tripeptide--D-alanyl-D-alanine ligase